MKYLSAVVLMELRAGSSRAQDRRVMRRVQANFRKTRRILTPSSSVFADAGDVLCRLRSERGRQPSSSNTLVNDILIALSARSIGATVVTQNEQDYRAIRALRYFHLILV